MPNKKIIIPSIFGLLVIVLFLVFGVFYKPSAQKTFEARQIERN